MAHLSQSGSEADLKNIPLIKLLDLALRIRQYIVTGMCDAAFAELYSFWSVLPPDVKRKPEVQKDRQLVEDHDQLRLYISNVKCSKFRNYILTDPTMRRRACRTETAVFGRTMLRIVEDIMDALYESYLRMGYKGFNVDDAMKFTEAGTGTGEDGEGYDSQ